MDPVAVRLDEHVDVSMKEIFHEVLYIINNNIYSEWGNTVKLLSPPVSNQPGRFFATAKSLHH